MSPLVSALQSYLIDAVFLCFLAGPYREDAEPVKPSKATCPNAFDLLSVLLSATGKSHTLLLVEIALKKAIECA